MKRMSYIAAIGLICLAALAALSIGVFADDEIIYTVTLYPGEGSGRSIVYELSAQTELPSWKDADNLQFYKDDNGSIGFRLDYDYCPPDFTPPEGYVFDTWNEGGKYHTLSSAVTTFTALWKPVSASYSLSPSEYTITGPGYTDIQCAFDSLVLGKIVNEDGETEMAHYISFYMNAGTLTDAAGNGIPFLVDDESHFGADKRVNCGNGYSSPDDTFVMAVYIAPGDYENAAPGTYTGDLRYDSVWNGEAAGESGSISLTLVKPKPPEFSGHWLALSGRIGVGFGVDVSNLTQDEIAASSMTFTVGGKSAEQTISDAVVLDGRYVFFCNVGTIRMAEKITAVFSWGDGRTISQIYSAREYLDYVVWRAIKYPDEQTIVKAMNDYGYYAQKYLSLYRGWTIGLDYTGMTAAYDTYTSDEISEIKNGVETAGKKFSKTLVKNVSNITYSLTFDTDTAINIYITPAEGYTGGFSAAIDGGQPSACVRQSDGSYKYTISGIPAHKLGDVYEVSVSDYSGGTAASVTVSPLSYVWSLIIMSESDTNTELNKARADVACALYRYYEAAISYYQ